MTSKAQPKDSSGYRIFFGFLTAPLFGQFCYQVVVIADLWHKHSISLDTVDLYLLLNEDTFKQFALFAILNYGTVVLFGLPIFIYLYRLRLTDFWISSVVGGLIPLIPFFILSILDDSHSMPNVMNPKVWMNPVLWMVLGFMVAHGATSGALFWLIARPDRRPLTND